MKEIEFTEKDLCRLQELGAALFGDSQDPRSYAYVRKLNRPTVKWGRIILYALFCAALPTAIFLLFKSAGATAAVSAAVSLAFLALYLCLTAKKAALCLIKIYQRYAPDSIRNKCRFEPSCSEYTRLAIEKYGLCRGLKKGICRMKRCNTDGGGYDYP